MLNPNKRKAYWAGNVLRGSSEASAQTAWRGRQARWTSVENEGLGIVHRAGMRKRRKRNQGIRPRIRTLEDNGHGTRRAIRRRDWT